MSYLKYDHFRVLVSDPSCFNGKCPLCGTPLEANVPHECANGQPIVNISPATAAPQRAKTRLKSRSFKSKKEAR